MEFEWDPGKRAMNILKHGLYFEDVWHVFNGKYITAIDTRRNYGEIRLQSMGVLHGRVVMVVYTQRGNKLRIISMRKANEREKKSYQKRS